jgi:hypothetical protein
MATTRDGAGYRRARLLITPLGLVAFLGLSLVLTAPAQEKEGDKKDAAAKPAQGEAKDGKAGKDDDKGQKRLRGAVRLGYTRPANIDDQVKGDKVIPVAFTDATGKIIAGTVYFTVLERADRARDRDRDRDGEPGEEGDTWATGMGGFDGRFVPGRNFEGGVSPRLDTRARYIYLYQFVNDPGLDPYEIKPAAIDKVRAEDVAGFALKLLVDPRYITSWGHFQGSGFTAFVPDRALNNQIRLAANGEPEKLRMAVSSNPSILAEVPVKAHRYRSPAYSLGKLAKNFDLGNGLDNLAKSFDHQYLVKQAAVLPAAFVQNQVKVDDRLKEPNFVQIQYFTGSERLAAGNGDVANRGDGDDRGEATGIFRVDWRAGQMVKLGQHSVVFGFTTDLPPVDEPIVIADPEEALRSQRMIRELLGGSSAEPAPQPVGQAGGNEAPDGLQFASFIRPDAAVGKALLGQGRGTGAGVAPGTAPTPTGGGAAAGGAMAPGGTFGSVGGLGGIGGGGPFGFPGGGIGGARAPAFGGGSGGGTGSGNGTPTQNQAGTQTPTQSQQGTQTGGGNTVNFNATLVNQQQQQQGQFQTQAQAQAQTSCCNMQQNVVPAPASLLLAVFGLPGLFVMWRRQRTPAVDQAA